MNLELKKFVKALPAPLAPIVFELSSKLLPALRWVQAKTGDNSVSPVSGIVTSFCGIPLPLSSTEK